MINSLIVYRPALENITVWQLTYCASARGRMEISMQIYLPYLYGYIMAVIGEIAVKTPAIIIAILIAHKIIITKDRK